MPPKAKFTKKEIIEAGIKVIRRESVDALTARSLARELNSSARPIFTVFNNMEEVKQAIIKEAEEISNQYQKQEVEKGENPPYKAVGLGYIRFAQEEKELFKLLFMRDRTNEKQEDEIKALEPLIKLIQKNTGLNKEQATMLHLEMWVFIHGIASMLATGYLDWDWNLISQMLTDGYEGISKQFVLKEKFE